MKKKQPARKGGNRATRKRTSKQRGETQPVISDDGSDRAFLAREKYDEQMHLHEQAWRVGSVPALVDALILCHKEREPIPLWLAQGAIGLIKMLFTGKTMNQRGRLAAATTRHRSYLIDYARWDAVKELADRRDEILLIIASLSLAQQAAHPEYVALKRSSSLERRCAAVAEHFNLNDNPAKGSTETILRSYKRVERAMRHGNRAKYTLPDRQNPLSSTYNPF